MHLASRRATVAYRALENEERKIEGDPAAKAASGTQPKKTKKAEGAQS